MSDDDLAAWIKSNIPEIAALKQINWIIKEFHLRSDGVLSGKDLDE